MVAEDAAVMDLITDNNEMAYLQAYQKEVEDLTCWCQDNNLHLNISKDKELIVDFGMKQGRNYAPLLIPTGPQWRRRTASGTLVSTSLRA